jgi:hypothetical protein
VYTYVGACVSELVCTCECEFVCKQACACAHACYGTCTHVGFSEYVHVHVGSKVCFQAMSSTHRVYSETKLANPCIFHACQTNVHTG